MKTKLLKLLPLLLCMLLVLSLIPAAFADDSAALFADFKAACKRGDQAFDVSTVSEFTILESITIPQGMSVNTGSTRIVVPQNVTLRMEGRMEAADLAVNAGGSVVLENTGWLFVRNAMSLSGTLTINNNAMHASRQVWDRLTDEMRERITFNNAGIELHADAGTWDEMRSLVLSGGDYTDPHIKAVVEVRENVTMGDSLVIPAQVHVTTWEGFSIPDGKTLTVNGSYEARRYPAVVAGAIVNNNQVSVMQREADVTALLAFENGGVYSGGGELVVKNETDRESADSYLDGLNLSGFDVYNRGSNTVYRNSGELFAAFKAACLNNADSFDLSNKSYFEIEEDLTIPAGMTVDARGTRIIVPIGNQIRVEGKLILTAWNLNGQTYSIVVPEGGELRIAAWSGLAINIWQGWNDDGSINRVTFDDDAGLYLGAQVENESALKKVLETFSSAEQSEHIQYEIRVAYDCSFSDNTVIPSGVRVILYNGMAVPESSTLTVNGTITAQTDVVMTVNGTLINNNFVEMERRTTSGAMLQINGTYGGKGTIGIKDHGDLSGYASGLDWSQFTAQEDSVGTRFFYITRANVADAIEQAAAEQQTDLFLNDLGYMLTVNRSVEIPEGLNVHFWGSTLLVPENVTLTLKGSLNGGFLSLDGTVDVFDGFNVSESVAIGTNGSLVFEPGNSWANIGAYNFDVANLTGIVRKPGFNGTLSIWFRPEDESDIADKISKARLLPDDEQVQGTVYIPFHWTVGSDMDTTGLRIEADGAWNANAGVTVTNGATLTVEDMQVTGCDVFVENGTLSNVGHIQLREDLDAEVSHETGRIVIGENGSYAASGEIGLNADLNPADYILGIDWAAFDIERRYDEQFIRPLRELSDAERSAIENGDHVYLSESVVISGDLTVHEDTIIEYERLIIADGTALTVKGEMHGNSLTVNGALAMVDNAFINVYDSFEKAEDRPFSLAGNAHAMLPGNSVEPYDGFITFNPGEERHVTLVYRAYDPETLEMYLALGSDVPENYDSQVEANFNWTLTGDLVVHDPINLFVGGAWNNASITVPAGVTLTVNNYIEVQGGALTIRGTLINNGLIELSGDENPDAPYRGLGSLIIDDGRYAGWGSIGVRDEANPASHIMGVDLNEFFYEESWRPEYWYNPPVLVLPSALDTIETEAFVGVAAKAVVIPESVNTIEDAAFDQSMVLVGNTAVENYAQDNGMIFIPTENYCG